MTEFHTYTKIRYEFDKWPLNFKDTDIRLISPNIIPQDDDKEY
jgi:hypothetical protein